MRSQADDSNQGLYYIFTREEADRLITETLDTSLDEPEPFVRLLLVLHDHWLMRFIPDWLVLNRF